MVKNSLEYYKTSGEDQYFETGRFKVLDDLYEYLEIEREDLQKTKFTKITKK